MNIGEASKRSGVSAKMIRYYEGIGLIPRARRTYSDYRWYDDADVHRLCFVRRARDLGFSVPEIKKLLGLWKNRSRKSADVKRLAKTHIADLEDRIREMQELVDTLKNLVRTCAGDNRPNCPILANLEREE